MGSRRHGRPRRSVGRPQGRAGRLPTHGGHRRVPPETARQGRVPHGRFVDVPPRFADRSAGLRRSGEGGGAQLGAIGSRCLRAYSVAAPRWPREGGELDDRLRGRSGGGAGDAAGVSEGGWRLRTHRRAGLDFFYGGYQGVSGGGADGGRADRVRSSVEVGQCQFPGFALLRYSRGGSARESAATPGGAERLGPGHGHALP
mmetsp:Transcript_13529/g.25886  ORF Transcript_13529/g.25886 Transcript_13529/m.25886 type:complete len:201 (+) Transcript_13529:487-1089(+)